MVHYDGTLRKSMATIYICLLHMNELKICLPTYMTLIPSLEEELRERLQKQPCRLVMSGKIVEPESG